MNDIQYLHKELNISFSSITSTNLGQFSTPGEDLNSACPDVFKTPPCVQYDHVFAEIFEFKDTLYHSFIVKLQDQVQVRFRLGTDQVQVKVQVNVPV